MTIHRATWVRVVLAMTAAATAIACSSSRDDASGDEEDSALVKDIASMKQEPDGTFTVTCKNGAVVPKVSADAVTNDQVCSGEYTKQIGERCYTGYNEYNPHNIHQCVQGAECVWNGGYFVCSDKLQVGSACTKDSQCLNSACVQGKCQFTPHPGALAPGAPPAGSGSGSGGSSGGASGGSAGGGSPGCTPTPFHAGGYTSCCCAPGYHCSTSDIYHCYPD